MEIKFGKNNYLYSMAILGGSFFLSLILILFVIKPLYVGNQKLSEELIVKKNKSEALAQNLQTLKQYKSKEKEVKERYHKVLAALPEKKDVARIFSQFEKMVSSTGASVKSVNGSSASTAVAATPEVNTDQIQGLTVYTYTLDADTTTYESLKGVLTNTEIARRITEIDGFSITKNEDNFSLTFNLKTFARGDAK